VSRVLRPSAKAVIAEESRILLNHLRHPRAGDFYELPGGGIRAGETIRDALRREVREETGYTVDVHELLWVREFIAANHDDWYLHPPGHHGVLLIYRCTLDGSAVEPHEADDWQVGVEWLDADDLETLVVSPPPLVDRLQAFLRDRTVRGPTFIEDLLDRR
jgi:8-oxo-dGTP pyrophosphatase MutT (NUDIX family)